MVGSRDKTSRTYVAVQLTIAGLALITGAATPPSHGRLLLVPLYSGTIDERHLVKAGLTRVGPGPIPGSLVVQGLGLQLAPGLLEKGVLMLAAPASLCSELKRD
jgi:hypothetical protein